MKYYIKIVTGFRDDQFTTVPMQEAHKAYYLFKNPEQRGIFNSGLALVGSSIKEIRPDYNATMRWNPDHKLDADDFNQINANGIQENMNLLLEKAKLVSEMIESNPTLLQEPLIEVIKLLPQENKKLDSLTDSISTTFRLN